MATLLFRRPRQQGAAHRDRVAIIDIGSNSVRLVVYEGAARLPAILFNEKVMAGLGRSLSDTGAIDAGSLTLARAALARFAMLSRETSQRTAGPSGPHSTETISRASIHSTLPGRRPRARK